MDRRSDTAGRHDDAGGKKILNERFEWRGPTRAILLIVALLAVVLLTGTFGLAWIEGQTLFDSFYMALTTLTTVGYGELFPLSRAGRLFNAVLIISGVTVVFVAIGILGDVLIKLELGNYFGQRKVMRRIERISDHYIICGLGRVGRGVIKELKRHGAPCIAIDRSEKRVAWARDQGLPALVADATLDATLEQAAIHRAKGLVAAIGSDAENVYVTLSARVLNPDLLIASRATTEDAAQKLERAGAQTVFTPYTFIGHRLAQALLRPHVLSFLDVASAFESSKLDLEIEQVKVSPSSSNVDLTIEESNLQQRLGVIVLAVAKPGDEMKFNPSGATRIESGDVLVVMGERRKLEIIEHELES